MGPSLYDGLNPEATGASDMRFFDNDRLSESLSEYAIDQEYRRRAIDFAVNQPQEVGALAIRKLGRYWKPWPNAEQFRRWPIRIILSLYTIPLYCLSVLGAFSVRRQFWSIVICAAPIFYFAAIHAIFVSSLRYRLPGEAALLVLAAIGISRLFKLQTRKAEASEIAARFDEQEISQT